MDFLDKGKMILKQFTEGVVESPAFKNNIKISHTVVKAKAIPADIKKPIRKQHLDAKSKKCKTIAKNNSTKIRKNVPDRHL